MNDPAEPMRSQVGGRAPAPLSFHLRDAAETEQFGFVLGDLLRSLDAHPRAVGILLSGELGAGKTTFTRGLADGLGADPSAIASPTFTIRMDHRGETRALAHLDAWRLDPASAGEELATIGFDELLAGDAVVVVEWPERLGDAAPSRRIVIRLEHADAVEDRARACGSAAADEGDEDERDSDGGEPTRVATISLAALDPREARRIDEGLRLLVQAPRLAAAACPVCGRPLADASDRTMEGGGGEAGESPATHAPFCSKRCRLADLGDWLLMRHRIAGAESPELDDGVV
jgi:tRNA threonylcarbamoyladenosine biosynthesis protein TsaE